MEKEMFDIQNDICEPFDSISEIYYNGESEKSDCLFSLGVSQITVTLIMMLILFFMSFFGSFRDKIKEAVDYIQSFEITKSEVGDEIRAMRDFFYNADV